jgi:hypothetical protein
MNRKEEYKIMDTIDIRNLTAKWFSDATPKNYKDASTTIGSGDNGVITITAINDITDDKLIDAVVATGNSKAMTAVFADGKLTITLGTDGAGTADATKNTATLIAEAIDDLDEFTATVSGTGDTAIADAITEKAFTAGQLGTPCMIDGVALLSSGTYYVCIAPDATTKNANWRSFTLTAY